jgi:hypothetical protein
MSGDAPSLPAPAPARVPRRALRWLVGATVALLAVFHGWLLIRRLVDASIAEPEVLLRWLGACGLLAGAAWLRPRGLSVSQGRPALVFWLLVLVLHVGASPVVVSAVRAEELLLVLPLGLAAAGGALVAVERRLRRRVPAAPEPAPRPRAAAPVPLPRRSAGASPDRFSPRPPPRLGAIA